MGQIIWLLLLILASPLSARDDDFSFTSSRFSSSDQFRNPNFLPYVKWEPPARDTIGVRITKEMWEGAVKGEFITNPTIPNILGNMIVNVSPAYVAANLRDFSASVYKAVQSKFQEHKGEVFLSAAGMVPMVKEVKLLKQLTNGLNMARGLRRFEQAEKIVENFAPALKSGLTRRLQVSISAGLEEGEVLAIRARNYKANFFDGLLQAKPSGVKVLDEFDNGVRTLKDGRRVISDLDIAFFAQKGRIMPESESLKIGRRINETYGHVVVTHGDNFAGARKGIKEALKVEKKTEDIYIFVKDGFLDKGSYRDMLNKYRRQF